MNRLTKDLNTPHDDTTYADVVKNAVDRENIVLTKLKHYEDIEDELGFSLIILFKALTDGFIARYRFDSEFSKCIVGEDSIEVDFRRKCFTNNYTDDWYFKNYGKEWALTKEELENDK